MFELARADQNSLHSTFNLIGWLCFVIGIALQLNLIPVLFGTIFKAFYAWNVGDGIEQVGRYIVLIVAIILGSIVFLLTYAVCWMATRPLKTFFALAVVAILAMVPYYLKTPEAQEVLKAFL
jgi:hypothetical protein